MNEIVTVLSISPGGEDRIALDRIFGRGEWAKYTVSEWRLESVDGIEAALDRLRHSRIPIVLCERDLPRGSWTAVLKEMGLLPAPPFLIVTSRLADERFWAEALDLGAYDVLAKPFDQKEVVRVISTAWLEWRRQSHSTAELLRAGGAN